MKLCLNHMMRRPCLAIFVLMVGACVCASPLPLSSQSLYVSQATGSDSNRGTLSQPFLTIQKCATTAASGGTCYILAGTYHETVTPNSGITITPYNGESVTVTGADPVTGWSLYKGSIYQASVTMASGSNQNQTFANQVFMGNQMVPEAQWPAPGLNNNLFNVWWEVPQSSTENSSGNWVIVDSNLPSGNWTGAHVHFWSGSDAWEQFTGSVVSSSSGRRTGQFTVSLDPNTPVWCPYICPGGAYYLFGSLLALTEANQWYYNSSTGVLYLWAPGGVNPSTLSVSAKQRQYCFDLSYSSDVTIENLNLFACSVNTNTNSLNNTLNGLNVQYVSHFTYIEGDESGIFLQGSGNSLINSTITYSAGNGVFLTGSGNTVSNNLITNTGYMGIDNGISLDEGFTVQNTTITHNTIYMTGRAGIGAGTVDNVEIGYNNIFEAMQLTYDGGEIYINEPPSTAGSIDHNWLHNTPYGVGAYIDNGTNGWTIEQNVVWNNTAVGILLNSASSYPTDDPIYNNTVPDINSGGSISLSGVTDCGTTKIVNNRVLIPVEHSAWACQESDNGPTAPGATDMTSSVQVGCNFDGCSSEGPPEISGKSVGASILFQPQSVTVNSGDTATFSVTANGTQWLRYQWMMNGTDISGATEAYYTTPPTTAADNGEVFTVKVSNSIGSATSTPATLVIAGAAASPNFTLSASPNCLTIAQGSKGTSTITVTPAGGFSGSVNLAPSGLPSGVTATWSTDPTTSTSTLTLTASSTATIGTATVTITGTSGMLQATTTIALTVNVGSTPSFSLSASPNSMTIVLGHNGTSTITVASGGGFHSAVSLAVSGLPSGVNASFSSSSVTPPANGSATSTLTLTASSSATTGTATVTITGTSGSSSAKTTIVLTVNAHAAIKFVQVNSDDNTSSSPSSASSVAVAYPSAQTAGDLNIVFLSWGPSVTVSSVTDSNGNSYSLAVGPTTVSGLYQAIYYASGIKAGSNTVTVKFSNNASYPDVVVVEYSGVSTLDKTAAATGTGATAASGAVTTSYADELLFGGFSSIDAMAASGSGFTTRLLDGDGDLVEDDIVSTTGSYNATATQQQASYDWIAEMATFH